MTHRAYHIGLGLILVVYVVLGVLFATRTPAWQAPDEPAHYNYIAQVAAGDPMPDIVAGDWDSAYLDELKSTGFDPALLGDFDTIQYEDHQPPLYYWLLTPVYLLADGDLIALRVASMLMGVLVIVLAYAITRLTVPDVPAVALGAAALVAFTPQHLAILASVNNDALAQIVVAATLYACIRLLRVGDVSPLGLGLLVGIGFMTKTTTYFMAGIAILALLIHWKREPDESLPRVLIPFFGVAGLLALVWWGRNIINYGFPDFLGLRAHDAVVVGQPRTQTLLADVGVQQYLEQAISTTFNSFWGQFGWMAAPMFNLFTPSDNVVYPAIVALIVLAVVGLILRSARRLHDGGQGRIWALHVMVIVLAVLMFLYYNTQFQQFQGRYMFGALISLAVVLSLGVHSLLRMINARAANWLTPAIFGGFALLDAYLIWRVIPGALA